MNREKLGKDDTDPYCLIYRLSRPRVLLKIETEYENFLRQKCIGTLKTVELNLFAELNPFAQLCYDRSMPFLRCRIALVESEFEIARRHI